MAAESASFCTNCGSLVPAQKTQHINTNPPTSFFKKRWVRWGLGTLSVAVLAGFGIYDIIHSPVKFVREGKLYDYPSATVGNAFDRKLGPALWTSFKAEDNDTVVEVKGYITIGALENDGFRPTTGLFENSCSTSTGADRLIQAANQRVEELKRQWNEISNSGLDSQDRASNLSAIQAQYADLNKTIETQQQRVNDCVMSSKVPLKAQFVVSDDQFQLKYAEIQGTQIRVTSFLDLIFRV